MPPAPKPSDEEARLASLHKMNVLDTPAEERLDRITKLAAILLKTPFSMITLLDDERQWFKSSFGVPVCETSRSISFCGYAILGNDILVVEDATLDSRFADNPVVQGPPYIRFYAGCPVQSPEGKNLGTLCVTDVKPRKMTNQEMDILKMMAAWAQDELRISKSRDGEQKMLKSRHAHQRKILMNEETRLWNRRGVLQILEEEAARTTESNSQFQVILVQVNRLGKLQETEGKDVVQGALKQVSEWLRFSVGNQDVLGYWGDGNFIVIPSETKIESVKKMAESIRRSVARVPAQIDGKKISLTVNTILFSFPSTGFKEEQFSIEVEKLKDLALANEK